MSDYPNRVVVTGLGAVSCMGHGVTRLWDGLVHGVCGIRPLTRINAADHRIAHGGEAPLEPTEDPLLKDPAARFVVDAALEAVGQAGLSPENARGAALVLGTNFGAMASTERFLAGRNEKEGTFLDCPVAVVAARLALGGPRSAVSLSCASGNAAIGAAADMIRAGHVRVALAGGYDAISDLVWAGLCSLRAMSSVALRPFDKRRDGTIFGEGAGVLALESLEHALARGATPLAEFLGYGAAANAFHMTHPDADGAGMARAMRAALADAGIAPEQVDHINAHATGTPPNDRLETAAIKQVFGARAHAIPINGIKSMIAHAMGAAGALEAVAAIMTIRENIIPPTIGLESPDPECDLDYTPNRARRAVVRTALSNSAGFGGCNASVIFRKWEPHSCVPATR